MKNKILSLALLIALCLGLIPNTLAATKIKVEATDEELIALLPQDPEPIPQIENSLSALSYVWEEDKPCEEIYAEIISLTEQLTAGASNDTAKAKAIYQWVSSNISYDDTAFSYLEQERLGKSLAEAEYTRTRQAADPFYTFYYRRGVCEGYTELSMLMLTIAGLPSAYFSGYKQGATEQGMENGEGRHAWNAVYADGKWIWFDTTWGKWDMSSSFHKKIDDIYWYAGMLVGKPQHNVVIDKTDNLTTATVLVIPAVVAYDISPLFSPVSLTVPAYVKRFNVHNSPELKKLHLPDTLTKLDIYDCPGLTELIIPDSVEELSVGGCPNLEQVSLGDGLKEIGVGTFSGCTALTKVQFGNGVETIANNAFYGCSALDKLYFPNSLKKIEYDVFTGCTGLTEVVFPESIEVIRAGTFSNCENLINITLPQWLIDLGLTPETLLDGTRGLYQSGNMPVIEYKRGTVVQSNQWWSGSLTKMLELRFVDLDDPIASDPDHIVTRLEFTKFCVNLIEGALGHELTPASANTFSDTQETSVLKAYSSEIIQGVAPGMFAPESHLTKEQAATIFDRLVVYLSENTPSWKPLPRSFDINLEQLSFLDREKISSWAIAPIYRVNKWSIVNGDEKNNFNPQSELTYAVTATMIVRTWNYIRDYISL